MKNSFRAFAPFTATLALALGSVGCSSDDDATDDSKAQAAVVANYAELVSANYADALATAKDLDKAVKAFTAAPSEATLEAAKEAWLVSRDPYGLSEAYRFYQGPIDNDDSDDDIDDGPEGLLNSWPLDERYIDYVFDEATDTIVNGGIINLVDDFPTIDADVLSEANGAESDTSVSTGYHAVEFLLWGQDRSTEGPGARPYTDYVTGDDATAENADRRAEYLDVVSDLIVTNLTTVNAAWADGKANYRADFLKLPPREALGKIMLGMGSLSGAELSGERMNTAYEDQDQENEHSCFSDNTVADLRNNATSVQNVLLGRYGDLDGPGIDELVEAKDPALAKQLREQIQEAIDNIDGIKGTFDNAIVGDDSTPNRKKINAAILSLQAFTESLLEAADKLGVELKFDE